MVNNGLRYLGFLEGSPAGTVGAFMKGEEPVTMTVGGIYQGDWKLVSVSDLSAKFQNTKYTDLTATLNATDSSAAPAGNNF